MKLVGRQYDTGRPVRLDVERGRIAKADPLRGPEMPSPDELPWIAPGLIDLQLNGYGGQEFSSAALRAEKVAEIASVMDRCGVVRFCPTLTTQRLEVMEHGLRTIVAACEASADVSRRIAGVHLEGPYLSPEDGVRGAHPSHYCRQPDWDEFQRLQQAAAGKIRILTVAVELAGAVPFIRQLVDGGVVVSIGHTAANSDQIRAAVDAGARMSTHLGNGCHTMIARHGNYIWDQLAEDRLVAGIIADGHHLPPPLVKTFVRAKTPERCILVSDLAGQAGLPPGRYRGGLCDVEVLPGGRLVVAGQTELMAGASSPLGTGVANVIRFAGVSLAQAVAMAVHQPAALLGITPGGCEPGDAADLVLFDLDDEFRVRATVNDGRLYDPGNG